jgi:hypothetical protein
VGELKLRIAVGVAGWVDGVEKTLMVAEKVGLRDAELEV